MKNIFEVPQVKLLFLFVQDALDTIFPEMEDLSSKHEN